MGRVKWLVYITSFFLPVFGFVTFWVFIGRDKELKDVARCSMIAAFIGAAIYSILAAVGVTVFRFLWEGLGLFQ